MGIDIYARWRGQTEEEVIVQAPRFSITSGNVGYLREAYHGEPYATKHLLREAFDSPTCCAAISAATLQERLPETLRIAEERERTVYKEADPAAIERVLQSFRDFVALCAAKEQETGEPVEILASY